MLYSKDVIQSNRKACFGHCRFCPARGRSPRGRHRGFYCKTEDNNVKFEAAAALQRGGANGLLNFDSQLEILLKNTPPDFRRLHLKGDALSQHWIDGKDFRLRLYTERNEGLFGAVEFLIETKVVDEGSYGGSYTLTIENMTSEKSSEANVIKARGKIVCSVE